MPTPREVVSTILTGTLPNSIDVVPYGRNVDLITKPTVLVFIDEVAPAKTGGSQMRDYTFSLVLLSPLTVQTGAMDDELDDTLEEVLLALTSGVDGVLWGKATRGTFEEKYPAYTVTITITLNTSKE